MGVGVAWGDEDQTIVRLSFTGHWTIEELREKGRESISLIRGVKHPVYVISDFSSSDILPIGVLWQARSLNDLRPANWAAGVAITHDPLARNLLELFGLVYLGQRRRHLYIAKSVEDALELIDKLKREKSGS